MQNFGPVHIEKNIESAAYVDASTHATQNNTQVTIQPSVSAPQGTSEDVDGSESATSQSASTHRKVIFSGNFTDFARIINAGVLTHKFIYEDGQIASQQDVFAAFNEAFGGGLENYTQLLYQTKGEDHAAANSKIFDHLKKLYLRYASGEQMF